MGLTKNLNQGMKHIRNFLIVTTMLLQTACYDDYIVDYEHTAIYIPYQLDVRTFVVGEGMKIKFGAELGGVRVNTFDRQVNYVIKPELITPEILSAMQASSYGYIKDEMQEIDALQVLTASYYRLSNDKAITISKGNHTGTIELMADSSTFLDDPLTLWPHYALPVYLSDAGADMILEEKRYAVIALKYENMLFGNYLHGGVTVVKDNTGQAVDTIVYETTVTQGDAEIWELHTVAPFSLVTQGYSNVSSTKPELMLTLDNDNVLISSAEGATYEFLPEGESSFNRAKLLQERKLYLNYTYKKEDGYTYHAQDTLTFRNRVRDGINEWQDENPDHYK